MMTARQWQTWRPVRPADMAHAKTKLSQVLAEWSEAWLGSSTLSDQVRIETASFSSASNSALTGYQVDPNTAVDAALALSAAPASWLTVTALALRASLDKQSHTAVAEVLAAFEQRWATDFLERVVRSFSQSAATTDQTLPATHLQFVRFERRAPVSAARSDKAGTSSPHQSLHHDLAARHSVLLELQFPLTNTGSASAVFQLRLPVAWIKPLVVPLPKRSSVPNAALAPRWQAIEAVPLQLQARIGQVEMSANQLLRLSVGDVLTLDRPITAPLDVTLNQQLLALAFPCRLQQQVAVQFCVDNESENELTH